VGAATAESELLTLNVSFATC